MNNSALLKTEEQRQYPAVSDQEVQAWRTGFHRDYYEEKDPIKKRVGSSWESWERKWLDWVSRFGVPHLASAWRGSMRMSGKGPPWELGHVGAETGGQPGQAGGPPWMQSSPGPSWVLQEEPWGNSQRSSSGQTALRHRQAPAPALGKQGLDPSSPSFLHPGHPLTEKRCVQSAVLRERALF